jgi:hypothetical protein
MAKCQNCKEDRGYRCRCKLCKRLVCNDCWSKKHNSDYCERCEGQHARINNLHYDPNCESCLRGLHAEDPTP